MSEERCPEYVPDHSGFHSYRCDRPVKRDGLCGIHAKVKERRARERAEFEERVQRQRAEQEERIAAAPALVERLARHGVEVEVRRDGHITLPPAADLADALDAAHYREEWRV